MKRTPLRRTASLRRIALKSSTPISGNPVTTSNRKPLPSMSAKRRRDLPARNQCRTQVLERAGGMCEMRCTDPCRSRPNPATDVHELKRGASRSECWLDPEKCLAACRECHDFVTCNPKAAHDLGLALWSWEEVAS